MAYLFAASSFQYIGGTVGSGFSGSAVTLSVRFYCTDSEREQKLFHVASTSADQYLTLGLRGDIAGDPLHAAARGSQFVVSASASGYTLSSWQHGAATATTGAVQGFLESVAATAGTGDVSRSANTSVSIGARTYLGSPSLYMSGRLAELAAWSVVLNAAEINSLYKGFSPRRIRPQALLFYAPLARNVQDLCAAVTLTNNNAATVADHPRVY